MELSDVLNRRDMRALSAPRGDLNRISQGDGGHFEKRLEFGQMENGQSAIRSSKGHRAHDGVTPDYLGDIGGPGSYIIYSARMLFFASSPRGPKVFTDRRIA